jgi:hypothetical protein
MMREATIKGDILLDPWRCSRYRPATPIPLVGTRWSGCDASSSLQFATVGSPEGEFPSSFLVRGQHRQIRRCFVFFEAFQFSGYILTYLPYTIDLFAEKCYTTLFLEKANIIGKVVKMTCFVRSVGLVSWYSSNIG